jgi:transmembrane sensor
VAAEATEWFISLQEAEMSPGQREAFVEWLRRSPVHVEEFLQLTALHSHLGQLPELQNLDLDSLLSNFDTTDSIVPISSDQGPGFEGPDFQTHERAKESAGIVPATAPQTSHRRGVGLSLKLTVAIGFFVVGAWSFEAVRNLLGREHYSTGIGEQLTVSLVDGSQIELNARSSLSATVNTTVRELQLDNGEALFRVARNRVHPFRVHTPQATIEAKGTQFNIDVSDDGTVVTLLEGQVVVSSPASTPILLNPGEQIYLARLNSGPLKPQAVDTKAVVAWTEHRFVFEDAPLSRVVTEFNRYRQQPFIIQDPSLRRLGITGSFDVTGAQSFANSLSASGDLRITRQVSGAYLIERR